MKYLKIPFCIFPMISIAFLTGLGLFVAVVLALLDICILILEGFLDVLEYVNDWQYDTLYEMMDD